jgi:hypothetical protein
MTGIFYCFALTEGPVEKTIKNIVYVWLGGALNVCQAQFPQVIANAIELSLALLSEKPHYLP